MKNRSDKILDSLYENRSLLIRYFIFALIASILKYGFTFVFSKIAVSGADFLVWTAWAIVFYPLLHFFVFKPEPTDIFSFLTRIMIYIVSVGVLWFINGLLTSVFMMLSSSPELSLALGGVLTEVLCLFIMWKIVFKIKK
ncbi:MAG: hypothetical protein IJ408_02260 [Clostridia bacterium]|nr:hypothetical protein [Clostridia bacterium]